MQNKAKRHHYIPAFLLAKFTASGTKSDKLWVLDQNVPKQFLATPRNIACQNDLYSIESSDENIESDSLEKAFAEVEKLVSPIIREIERTENLPKYEEFVSLLDFIALLATRIPARRETFSKLVSEPSKLMLNIAVSTKERWEAIIEKMRQDGHEIGDNITYDDMKQFVEQERYSIELNQNYYLTMMLQSAQVIAEILPKRTWSLAITYDDSGGFISSDNPVSLVSMIDLPAIYSPGFGMPKTEVTVPLTKNFALIGRFEGPQQIGYATKNTLTSINSRTGMYNERFLFSSKEDFLWVNNRNEIEDKEALIKVLQRK